MEVKTIPNLINELMSHLSIKDRRTFNYFIDRVLSLIKASEKHTESTSKMMEALGKIVLAPDVSDKEKIQVLTLFFKNDVKKENESVLNESVH